MTVVHKNGEFEMPYDHKYDPDPRGLGWSCFYKMKENSEKIAQINADTNESETYGELLIKCIRVAMEIKKYKITSEDIISLCTDVHLETSIPLLASAFLGIPVANFDPSLPLSDLKYLMNLVSPKMIFCISSCVKTLETAIKELNLNTKLVVFGDTKKYLSFNTFLLPKTGENDFQPKIPNDLFETAAILFSSGTTGSPKGVCLTHYGILNIVNIFVDFFDCTTVISFSNPYWISYLLLKLSVLIFGGRQIISKKFDETKFLQIIEDYKITHAFLPPSQTYLLTAQVEIDKKDYNTRTLHTFITGGALISEKQLNKLRTVFPHSIVTQLYGMTEVTAFLTGFSPKSDRKLNESKITSCGTLISGCTAKVVDIETNEILGPNKPGELLVKTKRLMKGYYKNPEKTKEAYTEEGFFRTGDIVYYDEDYCFYIVDRIKEMFKFRSWQLVPAEFETILLNHPAVQEALVIGLPHEEDGDHPMAFVVPKKGAMIKEEEILKFFNDQVIDRKQLRGGLKFVDNFPKTATGKNSRRILRDMVINNKI